MSYLMWFVIGVGVGCVGMSLREESRIEKQLKGFNKALKESNEALEATGKKLDVVQKTYNEAYERLQSWEDDFKKVLNEDCAPDEKHCSCVPILRKALEEAMKNDK